MWCDAVLNMCHHSTAHQRNQVAQSCGQKIACSEFIYPSMKITPTQSSAIIDGTKLTHINSIPLSKEGYKVD